MDRLLSRFGGEAGGNSPQLFWFLVRKGGGAEARLEEVRNFLKCALVSWSVQNIWGGRGHERRYQPWEGGDRGLRGEVRLA